jgi:hypothetical protein
MNDRNTLTCVNQYLKSNEGCSLKKLFKIINIDLDTVKARKSGTDFSSFIDYLKDLVGRLDDTENNQPGPSTLKVADTWISNGRVAQNFMANKPNKRDLDNVDNNCKGKKRVTVYPTTPAQPATQTPTQAPARAPLPQSPLSLWSYWRRFLSASKGDNKIFKYRYVCSFSTYILLLIVVNKI